LPFNYDKSIRHIAVSKKEISNPTICDVLRVNGNSMEPKIEHSDLVVIKREDDWWLCHEKIVAVRTADGLTLKKLVVDFVKNSACLFPINPKYQPIFLDEDCQICGSLIYIIRKC